MLVSYIGDCQLLRALSRVLDLPAVASTTAFTYLHRIRLCGHDVQLTRQDLVTACIYVAAKVEEVHVSANQLINSARIISHPTQQQLLQSLAPLPTHVLQAAQQQTHQQPTPNSHRHHPRQQQQDSSATAAASQHKPQQPQPQQKCEDQAPQQQQQQQEQQQGPAASLAVVGEEYYKAKDALFTAEQIVLRLMNFQLEAPQPHKHLFNFCKLLDLSHAVAAAAVCLLNDVIAYTGLCLKAEPAVLAAAVLQCVSRLMLGSSSGASTQQQVGVDPQHQCDHGLIQSAAAEDAGAVVGSVDSDRQQHVIQHQQQHRQSPGAARSPDSHHTQQRQQQQQHRQLWDAAGSSENHFNHQQDEQQQSQEEAKHREHRRRRHSERDGDHHHDSTRGSVPSALLDGSWVGLIGLQQQEVTEMVQQLQQVLAMFGDGGQEVR